MGGQTFVLPKSVCKGGREGRREGGREGGREHTLVCMDDVPAHEAEEAGQLQAGQQPGAHLGRGGGREGGREG